MASGALQTIEEDYKYDAFDDGETKRAACDIQFRKLKTFITEYKTQLRDIEDTLNESLSSMWDHASDPVALHVKPYEQVTIPDLIKTENKLFSKVMLVFSVLVKEMHYLKETAVKEFYPTLALFGQNITPDGSQTMPEGEIQMHVAHILHFLTDLASFVERINKVVRNTIHQLASLYHPKQKLYTTSFKKVNLHSVWDTLGETLAILVTLDEFIRQNEFLIQGWAYYKRMMKNVRVDTQRFSFPDERMRQLEKLIMSIEGQLLEGVIFKNCIEQEFDYANLVDVSGNKAFQQEFLRNIQIFFSYLNERIGETNEIDQRSRYPALCALLVLYYRLFRESVEKKLFRQIFDMYKRIPIVHVFGNIVWKPAEFLLACLPANAKYISVDEIRPNQVEFIKNFDKGFSKEVNMLYTQTCVWMVRMESAISQRVDIREVISTRMSLFLQGVILAHRISNLFKTSVFIHAEFGVPLKQGDIPFLCQCTELLKAIRITFHRSSLTIAENLSIMIQFVASQIQRYFISYQASLTSLRQLTEAQLDALAAVNLTLSLLNGNGTYDRRLILHIAVDSVRHVEIVKDQDWEDIQKGLRKLDFISNLYDEIHNATNCYYLYWHTNLIRPFLETVYQQPNLANKLHYIVAAFQDPSPILQQATQIMNHGELFQKYKKEVEDGLFDVIISPLCRDIEADLRLHIHSHLSVSDRNPLTTNFRDLSKFLNLRSIRLFDQSIDIKGHVAHYLDQTFYNLTTVALHDWKTYEEMRNLALEKYGLQLTEVHLPGATLEQGLDILEIMRNIHIFVGRFNYNLNNQLFIEATTNGKYLNTINIRHASNSIRTHGTGIINTTVNFTYQFLRQKFEVFSQFLFDDHIKSRLMKDMHWFKTKKDELKNQYPFERAERFNKEIRKLGVSAQGYTYLDQFRRLITEIGNALGYVRLIKAGGQHYCGNAVAYLPNLREIGSFEESAQKDGMSPECISAAKNLDEVMKTLLKNFAEGTEYFKLLVDVFAENFRSARNAHLRNFHMIIPPLTVNYVEHILQQKEKMTKKGKETGSFTDDGFAIGVAYILKLLDLNNAFDSLHWFDVVQQYYGDESQKVDSTIRSVVKKKDDEQAQTLVLSKKRLLAYGHEFELLFYSVRGACIFFKE